MTYDDWKTDPEHGKSHKDLEIEDLKAELDAVIVERNRAWSERDKLRDVLDEILDECRDRYDVDPDPTGGHDDVPNFEMRIGTMIEEALHGPGWVG